MRMCDYMLLGCRCVKKWTNADRSVRKWKDKAKEVGRKLL